MASGIVNSFFSKFVRLKRRNQKELDDINGPKPDLPPARQWKHMGSVRLKRLLEKGGQEGNNSRTNASNEHRIITESHSGRNASRNRSLAYTPLVRGTDLSQANDGKYQIAKTASPSLKTTTDIGLPSSGTGFMQQDMARHLIPEGMVALKEAPNNNCAIATSLVGKHSFGHLTTDENELGQAAKKSDRLLSTDASELIQPSVEIDGFQEMLPPDEGASQIMLNSDNAEVDRFDQMPTDKETSNGLLAENGGYTPLVKGNRMPTATDRQTERPSVGSDFIQMVTDSDNFEELPKNDKPANSCFNPHNSVRLQYTLRTGRVLRRISTELASGAGTGFSAMPGRDDWFIDMLGDERSSGTNEGEREKPAMEDEFTEMPKKDKGVLKRTPEEVDGLEGDDELSHMLETYEGRSPGTNEGGRFNEIPALEDEFTAPTKDKGVLKRTSEEVDGLEGDDEFEQMLEKHGGSQEVATVGNGHEEDPPENGQLGGFTTLEDRLCQMKSNGDGNAIGNKLVDSSINLPPMADDSQRTGTDVQKQMTHRHTDDDELIQSAGEQGGFTEGQIRSVELDSGVNSQNIPTKNSEFVCTPVKEGSRKLHGVNYENISTQNSECVYIPVKGGSRKLHGVNYENISKENSECVCFPVKGGSRKLHGANYENISKENSNCVCFPVKGGSRKLHGANYENISTENSECVCIPVKGESRKLHPDLEVGPTFTPMSHRKYMTRSCEISSGVTIHEQKFGVVEHIHSEIPLSSSKEKDLHKTFSSYHTSSILADGEINRRLTGGDFSFSLPKFLSPVQSQHPVTEDPLTEDTSRNAPITVVDSAYQRYLEDMMKSF